jgi:hypothetical protein
MGSQIMRQQIVRQVIVNGNTVLEFADDNEGEGSLDLSAVVCAANDTTEIVWAADVSQIKSLAIKVDGICTIKTNDEGSPDNTLTFSGEKRNYDWNAKGLPALLLTIDVTSLFVVVPAGEDVTLTIMGNYDPTV